MNKYSAIRYGLWGALYGITMSWYLGDEQIGMIVGILAIMIFELVNKFALQKGDEQ